MIFYDMFGLTMNFVHDFVETTKSDFFCKTVGLKCFCQTHFQLKHSLHLRDKLVILERPSNSKDIGYSTILNF